MGSRIPSHAVPPFLGPGHPLRDFLGQPCQTRRPVNIPRCLFDGLLTDPLTQRPVLKLLGDLNHDQPGLLGKIRQATPEILASQPVGSCGEGGGEREREEPVVGRHDVRTNLRGEIVEQDLRASPLSP